ncbi:MAG: tripartite tricarboxylate transporter substrate binding protein BugD [Candidatus Accumulibacter sp.]|jgi:tripartite-type tricarboxylate transporter receptor subunit TctC|nr:tripartite tricarboxylate transporter substrate binding protein BugD [Accumulibacter sp.]
MLQKITRSIVCILMTFWVVAAMGAPQYPSKVITMVVPFASNGPSDTIARILAQLMSKSLKRQIIIKNVGGAGGTIGAAQVAQSAPDGYTLLVHHIGHATAPVFYGDLSYDPVKDFQPIGLINDVASTFVSRKDLPVQDFKGYLDYVRVRKDKVNMANAGAGSASHLCGLLFQEAIQTKVTPVPYEGTGPAMNDMLGGMVDIMCDQSTNTASYIKAGDINVYAVTLPQRLALMPEVPTADEAGLPEFSMSVWYALYAPAGTPQPIVATLVKALQSALQDADLKQRYAKLGAEVASRNRATPEALAAHLKSEIERWEPIIKKAGAYAD